jgi:hypothetical protein
VSSSFYCVDGVIAIVSTKPSIPSAQSVPSYIADGARIAAILAIWGIIAAFFTHGVTELGLAFETVWLQLGQLFALVGVLNAVLFVLYRVVDYWDELR